MHARGRGAEGQGGLLVFREVDSSKDGLGWAGEEATFKNKKLRHEGRERLQYLYVSGVKILTHQNEWKIRRR